MIIVKCSVVNLRMQTNEANHQEFSTMVKEKSETTGTAAAESKPTNINSQELNRKAFVEFVVCHLLLHFFVVNFIG